MGTLTSICAFPPLKLWAGFVTVEGVIMGGGVPFFFFQPLFLSAGSGAGGWGVGGWNAWEAELICLKQGELYQG